MSYKTMYKIQDDYFDIINQVEELEGELTPELEEALKINEEDREAKSLAYIQKIQEKEDFIDRIANEIKRLQAMKKSEMRDVDWLKSTLVNSVQLFGEYDTGLYRVKTRTSKSVNIIDENKVPTQFKTTEQTTKLDKTAIKKAIDAGDDVAGAEVVENKSLSLGKPKK